ncbi:MAG: HAD family phosphatase [Simkaniaceae bacterium]|nr:HAD family phosphatase [Simkaniaceae bacterium]
MSIALDIDGTMTDASHTIPDDLVAYLHELYDKGWEILFVTGRPFSYAYREIKKFNFPYILAVQNGADIIEMPSGRRLHSIHIEGDIFTKLDKHTQSYIVYGGMDLGDLCYYRPQNFDDEYLRYFTLVEKFSDRPWKVVEDFCQVNRTPLIKCFGYLNEINFSLEGYNSTIIRDPGRPEYHLNLITHQLATKGHAVDLILKKRPLIAAGDDVNDISMLMKADIAIVKSHAPEHMHALGDIVTDDLIAALEKATGHVE